MKNIWIIPFSALMMSLPFASCTQTDALDDLKGQNENTSGNNKDLVWTSFKAYIPQLNSGSRTSLEEGNNVYWNDGDAIAITARISDYESYKCVTKIEEGKAPTADFEGEVSSNLSIYFAFYPYDLLYRHSSTSTFFTIPSVQQAVAGSFANNINPSWAETEKLGGSLHFTNLASLIKFTITDGAEDLKSVRLTSNKTDVVLSGDMKYDLMDPENPKWSAAVEGLTGYNSSSVVMEGNFESGCTYYFVVAPFKDALADGFKLTFEKNDGTTHVVNGKSGIINELNSSQIYNIGNVSLAGAEFKHCISDMKFIAAVEKCYSNFGWTKNEDGTVPLTEGNLALMSSVTYLKITDADLYNLDCLKYFTGLIELRSFDGNSLGKVDLRANKLLKYIELINSDVTELNIEGLTNLERLSCNGNSLKELNVKGLTNLYKLECSNNQLTELDLSDCKSLTHLSCEYNNLTSLDLSNNGSINNLSCGKNNIASLEVSHLTGLELLSCYNNPISELNIGNLTSMQILYVYNTNISNLDLSGLTKLMSLNISRTGIRDLDLSLYPDLEDLYCADIPEFKSTLDFSNNPKLRQLFCENSGISELNLSKNYELEALSCYGNKISKLDLINNQRLTMLDCRDQQLENGAKLMLYLSIVMKDFWYNMENSHLSTVDVYFDNSVNSSGSHDSFDEEDCDDVWKK